MGRPRKFQPEELRALIEEGLPVSACARRLDVSTSTLYHAIRRYGLPRFAGAFAPRIKPWCPADHWGTYRELRHKGLNAAERRAIVEQDIAREQRA